MIRKSFRGSPWLPLLTVGIIIALLFIFIYATVFMFAEPGGVPEDKGAAGDISGGEGTVGSGDSSEIQASLEEEKYICLAIGKDEVSGLSDVIMLVSFDTKNMKANIIQIPRDTYFRSSEGSYRKINGAISSLGGIEAFAEALESALGIDIDYTIQFSLDAVGTLVDLLGGVTVKIPADMDYDDPSQNLHIHLAAGEHLLDGEGAKQFVRFRSSYVRGDIARVDAQKIFMSAFAGKLTTGVSILKIPAIINVMLDDVKTNMAFSECLSFAQKGMSLKLSDVSMITLPGNDARTQIDSGAWYYIINRAASYEVVNTYLNFSGSPLEESEFDKARIFTSEAYPHFEEIYYGDGYTIKEYRADDINKNGIGISVTDK